MTVETMEEKLISSGTVPQQHVHLYSRSDRHEVEGVSIQTVDFKNSITANVEIISHAVILFMTNVNLSFHCYMQ